MSLVDKALDQAPKVLKMLYPYARQKMEDQFEAHKYDALDRLGEKLPSSQVSPPGQPGPPHLGERRSEPTNDETIAFQHKEIYKTLLAIEGHLSQDVRIAGKPCDCIYPKHSTYLQTIAEESISIDPQRAEYYRQLADFGQELDKKTEQSVVASGAYDHEFPEMAARARGFRKEVSPKKDDVNTEHAMTEDDIHRVTSQTGQIIDGNINGGATQ